MFTRVMMRPDELGTGDGLQLCAPLVQQQLDVAERLQPSAELRSRLADTLGEGTYPAPVECVEVQHAVGLTEAKRAQDHGLGLVRAPRHARSVVLAQAGSSPLRAVGRRGSTRCRGH